MARLISSPDSTVVIASTPISGPNARGSGSTTASDGSEQTFSSIGDVVAFDFKFVARKGAAARRERGWFKALHSGVNATRFTFCDLDKMSLTDAGIQSPPSSNWSNGQPWANGLGWAASYPLVSVVAASSLDSGVVELSPDFWGHSLDIGDYVGFMPFHFGMYTITEVIVPGKYRIWPRLRRAITTDDFATLTPTIAMRPISAGAISQGRGLFMTNSQSISMVEVFDYDVRSHFTG